MKTFCIAGPILPGDHYFIPKRLPWEKLDDLLDQKLYYVLHAPRQSGKTTAVLEYTRYLNAQGKYTALYLTTEPAHVAHNDIERTVYWLLSQFETEISKQLSDQEEALAFLRDALKNKFVQENALYRFLFFWAQINTKPLALFFDEIDGLVEKSLIFFLKQMRTGYPSRPALFPQSVCLIGVRSLQDYKLQSIEEKEKGVLLSPFNIVADSLLLRNFTSEQVRSLYLQHTEETGQAFTEEALNFAYEVTQGQPWLVNALAYQACFRDTTNRSVEITRSLLEKAKEQLILRRDTHIDALVDRLNEPRVRGIIDAILSGSEPASFNPDDIQYVRDLGLVKEYGWEIANPIYQQVIPRALTHVMQELIREQTVSYIDASGKLIVPKLLEAFTQFFRENSESFGSKIEYNESFPHLLLMAFLQKIINGGGHIHREYAVGRRRLDLLVLWKQQKIVIELKIKYGEDTLSKGLEQTAVYMDIAGSEEGHLLIFDRTPSKPWDEKISNELITYQSKKIHVWTM